MLDGRSAGNREMGRGERPRRPGALRQEQATLTRASAQACGKWKPTVRLTFNSNYLLDPGVAWRGLGLGGCTGPRMRDQHPTFRRVPGPRHRPHSAPLRYPFATPAGSSMPRVPSPPQDPGISFHPDAVLPALTGTPLKRPRAALCPRPPKSLLKLDKHLPDCLTITTTLTLPHDVLNTDKLPAQVPVRDSGRQLRAQGHRNPH